MSLMEGKRDLLCLPAWLLLMLVVRCEGDACPFMSGLFSVLDGAGITMTRGTLSFVGTHIQ